MVIKKLILTWQAKKSHYSRNDLVKFVSLSFFLSFFLCSSLSLSHSLSLFLSLSLCLSFFLPLSLSFTIVICCICLMFKFNNLFRSPFNNYNLQRRYCKNQTGCDRIIRNEQSISNSAFYNYWPAFFSINMFFSIFSLICYY
jgi:hypothetical protein